ncbi:hypothetical protein SAMN02745126_03989 [Enhydrobacter aerosaccus]|uniref:Uncharacterized protein n=1 Tax=Enhydrobacter aerosaccus TaxID=225324 RepID=A0A1T4RNN8_9HYPH|nr:hypothetical protein [Enhydrobacter aerosaccus]SKA17572.1 hypothetical protein SAMN02745126_03989 [Enhydrobacter aerosaccus]
MTTTTNDILFTLDGTHKTTDIFQPFDPTSSASRRPFEVHITGTFVGRAQLLVSYDAGTTWTSLITLEAPAVIPRQRTSRPNTLYKVSWDDTVTGDTGGYTSGAATVFIGRSDEHSRVPYKFVKQVDYKGRAKMPLVWGSPVAVSNTGTSKLLVAANPTRRALKIISPDGNSRADYDLSGGTAVANGGAPLYGGESDTYTFEDCPVGAVTFICASGQSLVVQEAT